MPDYSSYPPRIQAILRPLSRELAALIDSVATGSLDVLSWQREVERLLARYISASFMAGRGRFTLDESELAAVRKWVAAQTAYLDKFALEMLNNPVDEGEDFPQKWRNRAVMYATSIVNAFYGGETWGIPLPAMPGDLSSQCGQSDRCSWRIVKLDGRGNWDAYWTLHPAEHCQTCIERARLWNPLQIRDYKLLIPSDMMVKEFSEITNKFLRREQC